MILITSLKNKILQEITIYSKNILTKKFKPYNYIQYTGRLHVKKNVYHFNNCLITEY